MSRPRSQQTFNHCKIFRFDLPNGEFYIGGTKVKQLNRIIPNFKKALQDPLNQDDLYKKMRENNWFFEQIEFKVIEEFSCKAHIHFNNKLNEKINELKPTYHNQSQKGSVRQKEDSEKNKFLNELFGGGESYMPPHEEDEREEPRFLIEDEEDANELNDEEIISCYDDIFEGKKKCFDNDREHGLKEELKKIQESIARLESEIKKIKKTNDEKEIVNFSINLSDV